MHEQYIAVFEGSATTVKKVSGIVVGFWLNMKKKWNHLFYSYTVLCVLVFGSLTEVVHSVQRNGETWTLERYHNRYLIDTRTTPVAVEDSGV